MPMRAHPISTLLVITAVTYVSAGKVRAQTAFIPEAKKATGLLSTEGRSLGTAFCVDRDGVFVTSASVLKKLPAEAPLSILIESGETSQTTLRCRLLRKSDELDLALLLSDARQNIAALGLGKSADLFETAPVTALGYPFGKLLSEGSPQNGPTISVTTGHVTSLRKVRGELQYIQLDASLNPGNSGSPVLSHDGKVVAVVEGGVYGSGVNLALPVEKLLKFLETPVILFQPALPPDKRELPVNLPIRLFTRAQNLGPMTYRFSYRTTFGTEERTAEPTFSDGCAFVRPLPVGPSRAPLQVRVMVEGADGSLSGFTPDAKFRCGGRELMLSEATQIRFGTNPTVTLASGTQLHGPVAGLEATPIDIGGLAVRVDVHKTPGVRITRTESGEQLTAYHITVLSGRKVVAETRGTVVPDDGNSLPTLPARRPQTRRGR
jgi:hypothetical protein